MALVAVLLLLLVGAIYFYNKTLNDLAAGACSDVNGPECPHAKLVQTQNLVIAALILAQGLVASFSGKGLVPNSLVHAPFFIFSVASGAGLTVYLATLTGFPISTTHALVGGLVGAGMVSGNSINFNKLWVSYFLPLLFSPLAALVLTRLVYSVFQSARKKCGVSGEICLCVDGRNEIVAIAPDGTAVLKSTGLTLTVDQLSECQTRYQGTVIGFSAHEVLSRLHYLSSGMVSFARGLNDTPKIVGLLIAAQLMGISDAILWVALIMAVGGLLQSHKVARTMSKRITSMNHGQGFAANLVAALLVTLASVFSLPVSTTHVTCGAIFGIGQVSGKADWSVIRNILMSWMVTLPVSALLSGFILYVQQ